MDSSHFNMKLHPLTVGLLSILLSIVLPGEQTDAADWSVPVAGNAFRTGPSPGGKGFQRNGTIAWNDTKDVFSVYFHVSQPAVLNLAINALSRNRASTLSARVGQEQFAMVVKGREMKAHVVGQVEVAKAGYVRVEFQGNGTAGEFHVEIRDLIVSSDTEALKLDYVTSNKGNMFYWGRRGPSVHLRYDVPRDRKLRYAYSEITVPEGQDPIGSYYMANGFGQGYFGIQVNSPKERRILFSVWSPFKTDDPKDIPKDQRILALGKGPEVHIGEFGNEGSGGQSYLVFPWKSGTTYRFLTEVKPTGDGSTDYTAWFGDKSANTWRLIASFRRPKTDTHLRGFHSFLESFSPAWGHVGRRAFWGNVWVRDTSEQWHECTRARFSVDATGGGRHRLDFTGGSEGDRFYMRNCGFFDETGRPGDTFIRKSSAGHRPTIDFGALPRG